MSKNKEIYIFVQDKALRIFAVAGPVGVQSSNEWLDKGIAATTDGRQVSVIDLFEDDLRVSIEEALSRGFTRVSPDAIIVPPKDRSAEYSGVLPKYAASADRDRVVQILCKSVCGAPRWAELDRVYPGKAVMKKAKMGEFSAKCLRCGTVARDSYNWYR